LSFPPVIIAVNMRKPDTAAAVGPDRRSTELVCAALGLALMALALRIASIW
jgi:hypothetical protein